MCVTPTAKAQSNFFRRSISVLNRPASNFARFALSIGVAVLVFGAPITASAQATVFSPLVRVHLAKLLSGAGSVVVTPNATCRIVLTDSEGTRKPYMTLAAGRTLTVEALAPGTVGTKQAVALSAGLCSIFPDQAIEISEATTQPDASIGIARDLTAKPRHYRGTVTIAGLQDATLRVIDTLPLEDYLKGVVGPEIGSSAPLEAVKAQAIAARTYAVKNFGKCVSDGGSADLDDTTRCQNYLGVDAENWRCRTAVNDTAGKILTFDGIPIDAVYATDCGGMTAAGTEPYLRPVVDADCAAAAPWTLSLPLNDLAVLLSPKDSSPVKVASLRVASTDGSGRVVTVVVTDARGINQSLTGSQLRKVLGYDRLRSTLFSIKIDSLGNCIFTGRGWGHGLGMCQNGAVAMAKEQHATYDEILNHYYSGIEITDLTSDYLQTDADTSRDASSNTSDSNYPATRDSAATTRSPAAPHAL